MGGPRFPSDSELQDMRMKVATMSGKDVKEVKVVISPLRICPLGAHIDHQGGTVSAMTISKGILLGFVPSDDSEVHLNSEQFDGGVKIRVDAVQCSAHLEQPRDEWCWGNYARGAIYALQKKGHKLTKGITGIICGSKDLDSSGLSSSAAVGVAYLLAFEHVNSLNISPSDNIEYDRLIENEYLGLKNGILDQSAVLLSNYGCLTCMDCNTKEYKLIHSPAPKDKETDMNDKYKIMLAFSGIKQALTANPGYNRRVSECQEAAKILLKASGKEQLEHLLCNVSPEDYEAHKGELEPDLAKRAEHYFSENKRVIKGLEAWGSGNLPEFGKLISESGLSSIQNYECGSPPLIQLYNILIKAPGVYGARFSGAGFRGCCIALVETDKTAEAAAFTKNEYCKVQPEVTSKMNQENIVVICDAGGPACVV